MTKYLRPDRNPLVVVCPHCKAGIGTRCYIPGTFINLIKYHPSREDIA